ncbi:BatA domain-containing protein [Pararhodospirillum photometricum]|uniref:Double-transmembrane region-like n=1 Tax=Pararhodospirillum photometricum DSM 122 TaxID=1150469 RepID=H6SSB1_PARPM|nr:BatA domain-containing protein [Pararhodospirillum photometricum]CCG07790.1 Double-transmembrane region-like [Pararhodospirillum photometricum DSM 122]
MPDPATLSLATPWALAALAALPALWWLLRVTPPAPRRTVFPALRLLRGLKAEEQVSARSPWWLLLLRVLIVVLAVLGLARPVFEGAPPAAGPQAVLLVLDDSWAAATDWQARQDAAAEVLEQAARRNQPVVLLTTARQADPWPPLAPRRAPEVLAEVQALTPHPWGTDRTAALERLARLDTEAIPLARAVWIHDGLEDTTALAEALRPGRSSGSSAGAGQRLAEALAQRAPLTVLGDAAGGVGALVLDPPQRGDDGSFEVTARRPDGSAAAPLDVWVRLLDPEGRILARAALSFAAGTSRAQTLLIPPRPPGGGGRDARPLISRWPAPTRCPASEPGFCLARPRRRTASAWCCATRNAGAAACPCLIRCISLVALSPPMPKSARAPSRPCWPRGRAS